MVAPPAGTVVTFDAAVSAGTSTTWSHTVGSGSNRAILVLSVTYHSSPVTAITYNGTALTHLITYVNSGFADYNIHGLLNPTAGTHTVAVTSGGSNQGVNSVSYSGVASFGDAEPTGGSGTVTVTSHLGDAAVAFYIVADTTTKLQRASFTEEGWGDPSASWVHAYVAANLVGVVSSAPTSLFFDMF